MLHWKLLAELSIRTAACAKGALLVARRNRTRDLKNGAGLIAEQPEVIGIRPERYGQGKTTQHIPEKHHWMTFNS